MSVTILLFALGQPGPGWATHLDGIEELGSGVGSHGANLDLLGLEKTREGAKAKRSCHVLLSRPRNIAAFILQRFSSGRQHAARTLPITSRQNQP